MSYKIGIVAPDEFTVQGLEACLIGINEVLVSGSTTDYCNAPFL